MGNHVENKEAEMDVHDPVYCGENSWQIIWRWFTAQWAGLNDSGELM